MNDVSYVTEKGKESLGGDHLILEKVKTLSSMSEERRKHLWVPVTFTMGEAGSGKQLGILGTVVF